MDFSSPMSNIVLLSRQAAVRLSSAILSILFRNTKLCFNSAIMSTVCSYFLRGCCDYGSACRNSHVLTPSREAHRYASSSATQVHRQSPHTAASYRSPPSRSSPRAVEPLAPRQWKATSGSDWTDPKSCPYAPGLPSLPIAASASSVTKFSVISFNILCPEFAFPHQYRYCPHWALEADFRAKKVFTQLQQQAADIVCLQELDQFEELWKPAMAKLGYQGFYKKRTGNQTDGVAIFFQSNKFKAVALEELEYRKYPGPESKDNVGLLVMLEPIVASSGPGPAQRLCVTNTHIHYNNRRGDLKLGQLQMLCQAIPSFCHRFLASLDPRHQSSIEMPRDVGLVLCGDFNATPNSALMEFVLKRRLHSTQHCRKKADGLTANSVPRLASPSSPQPNADSDTEQGVVDPASALNAMAFHPTDTTEFVHHSLPLASVYGPTFEDGQQRVTQYHAEHRLMCDYIMYVPQQLRPTGYLELPTPAQLGRRLMPNEAEPSDHFLLKAEFDWQL